MIDDKIQRILQNNDFKRTQETKQLSHSTEYSKQTNSINGLKPKKRRVVKLKNTLLSSQVSPDIQRLYYQSQKMDTPQIEEKKIHDKNQTEEQFTLPQIQKVIHSEQSSKTNLVDLIQTIQEIFPPEHQLWNDLLSNNQSIEEVVSQNQEYFSDLITLYLQEMEIRMLKDKKQSCMGKYSTQYTDDFNDKFMRDTTSINRWIYERAKQSASFLQNSSTYNQHFQPQRYLRVDNFKPDHIPNLNQISCLSSYAANYRDWKKLYYGAIGPFYVQSDKKLPFIAESNYTRNFVTQKYEKQDPIKPKPLGPFPVETSSLIRETTHQSQFTIPQQQMKTLTSPRSNQVSMELYQPHFNKYQSPQKSENTFAEKFFHSPVVLALMKKNQKQKIN